MGGTEACLIMYLIDDVCRLVVAVHEGPVVRVHLRICNGALQVVSEPDHRG
jgi:hypothetical protein